MNFIEPQFLAHSWPDAVDRVATWFYLAAVVGLPALGYAFLALDIRAYLRSLRRALVVAGRYLVETPLWARKDTPRCLIALGLSLPCTVEDVLAAYREQVKQLHPDRGGDRRAFLRLQQNFEQAVRFLDKDATGAE